LSYPDPAFDAAPYRLSGRVYGALLNQRGALEALGDAVHQGPYKAPPRAPVLYIKPRNTLASSGDALVVPADSSELEIGATLGIVIGRSACRVGAEDALTHVAGYVIVNDVSVPHASFYRPQVRCRARDGFCPIGPRVVARGAVADPDALGVRVQVDGALRQATSTGGMLRPVARLIADVTEFMTLRCGDVLLLGVPPAPALARAGDLMTVEAEGLGRLENRLVADTDLHNEVAR
jgi:5-oxopent-3-ene-1,2,5-tricarboxylate decarboxylase/2-hydroxyhepta-2,4-diene-1,7-dioate isomerase